MDSDSQPFSFAILSNTGILAPSSRKSHYSVDKFFLAERLSGYISTIYFDQKWYLAAYPDVAMQVVRDRTLSAHQHYVGFGYFEDRLPYDIEVDEQWYLENYPDLAEALKQNVFASAQDHVFLYGYHEGRLPSPGFQLRMAHQP